jgi:hypothetical protein
MKRLLYSLVQSRGNQESSRPWPISVDLRSSPETMSCRNYYSPSDDLKACANDSDRPARRLGEDGRVYEIGPDFRAVSGP